VWDGTWTATTLVEFANTALCRGFPDCIGIKLDFGFSVAYQAFRQCMPNETELLRRDITISGQTGCYGTVVIVITNLIEGRVQVPVGIVVERQDKKVGFDITSPNSP